MNKKIVIAGIILIIIAIVLGAFGGHALKEMLSETKLKSFHTGLRYQIYHGLAFLILGLSSDRFLFSLKSATSLLLVGVIMFSVSIYLLSIQELLAVELKFLGPVTPLGGSLMIVGWIVFLFKVVKQDTK